MASDEAVCQPGMLSVGCSEPAYRFLSPHQAAVLDAAVDRMIAKADIDPREHFVSHIDHLLSVVDVACAKGPLRVVDVCDHYVAGLTLLDRLADGDFTAVPRLSQELILSRRQVAPFADLLFDHIVEAMYALPAPADSAPRNRSVSPTRRMRGFR